MAKDKITVVPNTNTAYAVANNGETVRAINYNNTTVIQKSGSPVLKAPLQAQPEAPLQAPLDYFQDLSVIDPVNFSQDRLNNIWQGALGYVPTNVYTTPKSGRLNVKGTPGDDFIPVVGGNGNDRINVKGKNGNDRIIVSSGNGNDRINVKGGRGNDDFDVYGGDGNDRIVVDGGKGDDFAYINGGSGKDTIVVQAGRGKGMMLVNGGGGGQDKVIIKGGKKRNFTVIDRNGRVLYKRGNGAQIIRVMDDSQIVINGKKIKR